MYKRFFGLKENPFNVTPDPRYLYSTPHTEEALACLTYCVQSRKGFVLLTGDVGTGKTTLLNKLLEWLRQEQIASAFVFNPRLNPFQFLDYALSDFGVNCGSRLKSVILADLNNWLLERHKAGTTAVLVVDEAQDASPELLEEIRLLTNLKTPSGKLLQIVLSGQQELEMKLRLPEFRQLRQRITLRAKTHPLTLEETHEYVATRLRIAGSDGRQIFAPDAIDSVHHYSEGIPRVINILCEDSLVGAFVGHQPVIPKKIVEQMARELELDIYPPTAPPPSEQRLDDIIKPLVRSDGGRPAPARAPSSRTIVSQPILREPPPRPAGPHGAVTCSEPGNCGDRGPAARHQGPCGMGGHQAHGRPGLGRGGRRACTRYTRFHHPTPAEAYCCGEGHSGRRNLANTARQRFRTETDATRPRGRASSTRAQSRSQNSSLPDEQDPCTFSDPSIVAGTPDGARSWPRQRLTHLEAHGSVRTSRARISARSSNSDSVPPSPGRTAHGPDRARSQCCESRVSTPRRGSHSPPTRAAARDPGADYASRTSG